MEIFDEEVIDVQDQCSKQKPKRKSLCSIMQKKTKVGCLSTESEEINLQENVQSNWSSQKEKKDETSTIMSPVKKNSTAKSEDCQNKDSAREVPEIDRLGSARDFSNSTKLSLCCAMTESSRSLNHQQSSNYHRSNNTEMKNQNDQNVTAAAFPDAVNVNRINQTVSQASSIDETHQPQSAAYSREAGNESHQQEICSQSVPVSREPSLRISQSPSSSEISLCDSTPPMQTPSQAQLRRRLLSHRFSADNLLMSSFSCPSPSLRHSSPDSSRSAPEAIRGYKKRSSSHDAMLPLHQDGKAKRVSVPSRGSHGNLAPENGAIRGIVASMDSLARHSLLAAQVLHLIPTTKARERYKYFYNHPGRSKENRIP
jgi:hypothetical protein